MKVKFHYHPYVIIVTIFVFLFSSFIPAYAIPAQAPNTLIQDNSPTTPSLQPQIDENQQKAEELNKEIEALDHELEVATEAYNAVTVQLERINQELTNKSFDLSQAEAELSNRQKIYNNRIAALYKNGSDNFLEVLLSTKSFADLLSRVVFLSKITQSDNKLMEDLELTKDDIIGAREDLESLKQQEIALQQELEIKKAIIEVKINFRKELLASVNDEVRQLIDQEQQRRAAEARALLEYARSQLGVLNIDHSPGSVVHTAFQYLGIPYLWGGDDPIEGFDCSGLVMYVFNQHGVRLPHYSRFQSLMGQLVEGSLQPGDLVFFGSPVHHVGMYIGGDYFIHAPKTGDVVKISILSARRDFVWARRFPLKPKEEVANISENLDSPGAVSPLPNLESVSAN